MDIFDQRYYRLNKLFLSVTGQWPYDHTLKRHVILTVLIAVMITQIGAKVWNIYLTYDDTELLFDSLPAVVGDLSMLVKLHNYAGMRDKLIKLLDHLKLNWSKMNSEEEINVLQKYGERGLWLTRIYARVVLIAAVMFLVSPVAPRLIFRIGNMSAPRPLPHNVHYFVDNQEYYYPILMHAYVAIGFLVLCLVAADTMFFSFVQHACGLFSIIEYKLEHLVDDKESMDIDLLKQDNVAYSTVCECVQLHNNVMRFVRAMEQFYTKAFFVQAGFNMILISVAAFRAALLLGNLQLMIRMASYSLIQIIHLSVECYQGQQLIDHSLRVRHGLMNSLWYLTSVKTKKSIQFMLLATEAPCLLTAGKLFVISMEFCGLVLRTSMSYFTLLCSFG